MMGQGGRHTLVYVLDDGLNLFTRCSFRKEATSPNWWVQAAFALACAHRGMKVLCQFGSCPIGISRLPNIGQLRLIESHSQGSNTAD